MSFYSTTEWKRLRRDQLQSKPWCVYCAQLEIRTPATVVDHVVPHKGNKAMFYNFFNLQSLCKLHHDSTKQRFEKSGVLVGGDATGHPFDPSHHWNKA